jgi:serine/threonine protein kinase
VRVLQPEQKDGESSAGTGKASGKSGEILMGTPDYISPEQALGEALDGRTDIYSLGATFYFLLTGEPPFQSESPIALALMHVHEAPTPLGLLRADVTPQIDFVLSRVMAKWPDERFQTAGEFSAALDLAIKEAHEELSLSAKRPRVDSRLLPAQNGASEAVVQVREVPIKRAGGASTFTFKPWRLVLTLGLVVLLVLGCLLTALFIGSLNSHPSHAGSGHFFTPTSVVQDAFAQQAAWPTSSTFFFQDGAYHIQNKSSLGLAMAFYSSYQFTSFKLSVSTAEVSGSLNSADYYGIIFRASPDQSRYYLFEVAAWNKGQYGFLRYSDGHWTSLIDGRLTNFHAGIGQNNTLSIAAQGNAFTFAVNGVQTGPTVHDIPAASSTMTTGEAGLVVEEQNTEVAFAQLLITPL